MEVENNMLDQPGPWCIRLKSGLVDNFLSTSNFDLWYFCSLLNYKDLKCRIQKIWFLSVWRLEAKVLEWLLRWFIFAQSTLISFHTEAFVKTEVGCTVHQRNSCSVILMVQNGTFHNTRGCYLIVPNSTRKYMYLFTQHSFFLLQLIWCNLTSFWAKFWMWMNDQ